MVHVVLRDSTSIRSPCSADNRSVVLSGTNCTFLGSLKIAAAIARQKSTSKPFQFPCASLVENPINSGLTPQLTVPRAFTLSRVWADAAGDRSNPAPSRIDAERRVLARRECRMEATV